MKYSINTRRNKIIIIGTIFLLVLLVIMTAAYKQTLHKSATINTSSHKQNIHKQEEKNTSSSKKCSLEVRVGLDKKVVIPNPNTTKGQISVSLINHPGVDHINKTVYPNYLADLSFAGFDKPVFVSSYVVGNMTGTSDSISHVSRQTKNGIKEEEISGSCLALFVTTGIDTFKKLKKEDWDTYFLKSYFVIIDYQNGICYKKSTDFTLPNIHSWLDLSAVDLTGDGTQELIVSHCYNKSTDFGVYQANADTHKIKEIYSSFQDFEEYGDFIDRLAFEGELLNDYKVLLKFPCIGYSKTVSMITDGGYRENELHKKREDKWGCINFVSMWNKNGKLRKKLAKKPGNVFLYTLDGFSCVKNKDGTMQLKLTRSICIGHRSESVGYMCIYLEYDNASDALVIKNAEYVNANNI